MDVGTVLREARRHRGRTLTEVASSTKVPRRMLDDIDHNRFDRLPGGILTKGHLRAYAADIGLNPDQIVRQYVEDVGAAREELPIARPDPVERDEHRGRTLLVELVALALVVGFYDAYGRSNGVPPAGSAAAAAEPAEAGLGIHAVSPPAVRKEDPGVRVDITPSGPCWVSAMADDRLIVYRLLQPGDDAAVTAQEHLVLRVGDPGTFVYQVNGERGRRLGAAGAPVTVRITGDNYRAFVADGGVQSGRIPGVEDQVPDRPSDPASDD